MKFVITLVICITLSIVLTQMVSAASLVPNSPPEIVVRTPSEPYQFQSSFYLDASVKDDYNNADLKADIGGFLIASSPNGQIQREIKSEYYARRDTLTLESSDGYNRVVKTLPIYVDPSSRLKLLHKVEGRALDYDGQRILYQTPQGAVFIKTISSEAVQFVFNANYIKEGYLTSRGALLLDTSKVLYEAAEGKQEILKSDSTQPIQVEGNYVLFEFGADTHLRNLATGTTEKVFKGTSHKSAKLMPGGVVVYNYGNYINRYFGGTSKLWKYEPDLLTYQSDGKQLVTEQCSMEANRKYCSLALIDDKGTMSYLIHKEVRSYPYNYKFNNGWIVFQHSLSLSNYDYKLITPTGETKQLLSNVYLGLDYVTSNGTVVFHNDNKMLLQASFEQPYIREFSGKSGKIKWMQDHHYRIAGDSILLYTPEADSAIKQINSRYVGYYGPITIYYTKPIKPGLGREKFVLESEVASENVELTVEYQEQAVVIQPKKDFPFGGKCTLTIPYNAVTDSTGLPVEAYDRTHKMDCSGYLAQSNVEVKVSDEEGHRLEGAKVSFFLPGEELSFFEDYSNPEGMISKKIGKIGPLRIKAELAGYEFMEQEVILDYSGKIVEFKLKRLPDPNMNYGPVWQTKYVTLDKVDDTNVTIHWDPAKDDQGVANYKVYYDAAKPPVTIPGNKTAAEVTGLTPDKEYVLYLQAEDITGIKSTPITISLRTKETPFRFGINQPKASYKMGEKLNFSISQFVKDNIGPQAYKLNLSWDPNYLKLDDQAIQTSEQQKPFKLYFKQRQEGFVQIVGGKTGDTSLPLNPNPNTNPTTYTTPLVYLPFTALKAGTTKVILRQGSQWAHSSDETRTMGKDIVINVTIVEN
ncbi:fibronectin type III domain-containing protein [Paenibacillus swuensis]|nr:fibronectin type III domain-containing protein [Paenibacillus swuensis]